MLIKKKIEEFLKEEKAFFKKDKLMTAISLVSMASLSMIPSRASFSGVGYNFPNKQFEVTHSNHGSHYSHSTHSTHSTHTSHTTHSTHTSHSSHGNCVVIPM